MKVRPNKMKREYVLKVFREWIEETIEHIHTNTKEGSYDRKYSEAPYLATIKLIESTEDINTIKNIYVLHVQCMIHHWNVIHYFQNAYIVKHSN